MPRANWTVVAALGQKAVAIFFFEHDPYPDAMELFASAPQEHAEIASFGTTKVTG